MSLTHTYEAGAAGCVSKCTAALSPMNGMSLPDDTAHALPAMFANKSPPESVLSSAAIASTFVVV